MKVIIYKKYGSPDVLQLEEAAKPAPGDNEALVKVHAASVNSWDWDLLRGKTFLNRLGGLLSPKYKILGCDIAGQIEAVGRNVRQFQPGDEVLGDLSMCGWGGFAEYVCAREKALTLKPACMTFEQAAAMPQAAVLALQGLRDKGSFQPGQKVLMNGAGGGVGTFAVQMAKSFGFEVTGVDSAEKLDMLRSIGTDHVIDYRQEDFTSNEQCYDLIIDVVGNRSIFDYRRVLSPRGIYVMVGGSTARLLQAMLLGLWSSITARKKIFILLHKANKDLEFIIKLFEAGKAIPVIDRCYPLSEVPDAFRYFGEGRVKGKIVISVKQQDNSGQIES